jgi:hypothetical protein
MSSISGISGMTQPIAPMAAVLQQQQKSAAATPSNARDVDGDFDGTRAGQVDFMDLGKGLLIDRRA